MRRKTQILSVALLIAGSLVAVQCKTKRSEGGGAPAAPTDASAGQSGASGTTDALCGATGLVKPLGLVSSPESIAIGTNQVRATQDTIGNTEVPSLSLSLTRRQTADESTKPNVVIYALCAQSNPKDCAFGRFDPPDSTAQDGKDQYNASEFLLKFPGTPTADRKETYFGNVIACVRPGRVEARNQRRFASLEKLVKQMSPESGSVALASNYLAPGDSLCTPRWTSFGPFPYTGRAAMAKFVTGYTALGQHRHAVHRISNEFQHRGSAFGGRHHGALQANLNAALINTTNMQDDFAPIVEGNLQDITDEINQAPANNGGAGLGLTEGSGSCEVAEETGAGSGTESGTGTGTGTGIAAGPSTTTPTGPSAADAAAAAANAAAAAKAAAAEQARIAAQTATTSSTSDTTTTSGDEVANWAQTLANQTQACIDAGGIWNPTAEPQRCDALETDIWGQGDNPSADDTGTGTDTNVAVASSTDHTARYAVGATLLTIGVAAVVIASIGLEHTRRKARRGALTDLWFHNPNFNITLNPANSAVHAADRLVRLNRLDKLSSPITVAEVEAVAKKAVAHAKSQSLIPSEQARIGKLAALEYVTVLSPGTAIIDPSHLNLPKSQPAVSAAPAHSALAAHAGNRTNASAAAERFYTAYASASAAETSVKLKYEPNLRARRLVGAVSIIAGILVAALGSVITSGVIPGLELTDGNACPNPHSREFGRLSQDRQFVCYTKYSGPAVAGMLDRMEKISDAMGISVICAAVADELRRTGTLSPDGLKAQQTCEENK